MAEKKNYPNTNQKARLVGHLKEKNLELKQSTIKDTNIPCEVISGDMTVECDNGTFKLRVYSQSKKKDGDDNKMFAGIKKIYETYVPAVKADDGIGDYIDCDVKMGISDFVTKENTVSTGVQFSLNSANRVSTDTESLFDIDMDAFIRGIHPEIINEEETGRILVDVVGVNFAEEAEPYQLIVEEDMADAFDGFWEIGQTVRITVTPKMVHKGEVKKQQVGFGRAANTRSGYDKLELIIVGGSPAYEKPDDEETPTKVLQASYVKELWGARQLKLENLPKEKAKREAEKNKKDAKANVGKKKTTVEEPYVDDPSSLF